MTDDLRTLLRREAADLQISVAPVPDVLAGGRRIRRRRRSFSVLAVSTAVVLTGVTVGAVHRLTKDSTPQPATLSHHLAAKAGAISIGKKIYVDNGKHHASLPEKSAGVFYTSAGVLVRTSARATNGGPFHFLLVGPRGQARQLALTIGDGGLDAVPSQPYLVRTVVHEGTVDVVVDDVSTDREVARVALPGHPTWPRAFAAPPVSLDGDTAYVATSGTAYAVRWPTGTVTPNHVIRPMYGPVRGGRVVAHHDRVLDVSTGKTLLRFGSPGSDGVLSWDGRYLIDTGADLGDYVYDLATGHRAQVRGVLAETWTPDGYVFGTDPYDTDPTHRKFHLRVVVCSPVTGGCTRRPIPTPDHKFYFMTGGVWFRR